MSSRNHENVNVRRVLYNRDSSTTCRNDKKPTCFGAFKTLLFRKLSIKVLPIWKKQYKTRSAIRVLHMNRAMVFIHDLGNNRQS